MKVNIEKLIERYDIQHLKDAQLGSPITSITGLIGEDLILGILEHFFGGKEKIEIDRRTPVVGKRGSRLDAWIFPNNQDEHYQVEIKNWSACAIGGVDVDNLGLIKASQENHQTYLLETNRDGARSVWKVLEKMRNGNGSYNYNSTRRALLAFWSPISRNLTDENLPPFFEIDDLKSYERSIEAAQLPNRDPKIETVFVFSASLYLRDLLKKNETEIDIDMPRVQKRLEIIKDILPGAL